MNAASVVIIGAGPAGLTAALELQKAGVSDVTVLEADTQVGGISRTVEHHGNRIDIGGHRFFSKSDWVMDWWRELLPVAHSTDGNARRILRYKGGEMPVPEAEADGDLPAVMLLRNRLSRIYFNKRFFDYPLRPTPGMFAKLGPWKTLTYGLGYLAARLRPIRPENSLEDFLVNRFGRPLYLQFFKEYTEKVWGVPCSDISAAWGAQRIKSLSVGKAIAHALRKWSGAGGEARQTSLIESFLYPKYGPGQMWETAAARFTAQGGNLRMRSRVDGIDIESGRVQRVRYRDAEGTQQALGCTHLISSMPIKDLVASSAQAWPDEVRAIARDLSYRDFITVGLLYPRAAMPQALQDNWIYIQEPGVNVGRVQIFNNWSPYLVANPDTLWLGLEFFCKEGDALWRMDDPALQALGHGEMVRIGLVSDMAPLDSTVLRVPKAYPGYFGEAYAGFDRLRHALDAVPNLFLVGRNGMHRYNNQDHSMLTAREAARQVADGRIDKAAIWAINLDDDYHEEK